MCIGCNVCNVLNEVCKRKQEIVKGVPLLGRTLSDSLVQGLAFSYLILVYLAFFCCLSFSTSFFSLNCECFV